MENLALKKWLINEYIRVVQERFEISDKLLKAMRAKDIKEYQIILKKSHIIIKYLKDRINVLSNSDNKKAYER